MPFLSQNIVHMYLPSWSGLPEFQLCWWWSVPPLQGLLLWFRGFVQHPHLVPCDYTAQDVFIFLTVLCQKVQRTGLPFQFVFFRKHLRHWVCTQFLKLKFIRHNFVKKWLWNLRKCREIDVMMNHLFSLTFPSTAHTKSSFTTDSQPLHTSPCTLSCPSLNTRTHLCTTELLRACSTYTSQSWQWISASFIYFLGNPRIW
jgi:hypothetical protein